MKTMKRKGFTLVELLVVIAILAILAGVGVAGYTAFIERAYVSNDNTLVTQLNSYLVALKADSNSKHYGEDIDENNIWQITDEILEDTGINELAPQAAQYGYHFYFDLEAGEYVVMNDKDVLNSLSVRLFDLLTGAADRVYDVRPGNCFTKENRYFLVDTQGSDLADVVRGFYTFEGLEGETTLEQFQTFAEKVQTLANSDISALVGTTVFATDAGNLVLSLDGTHTLLLVHDSAESVANSLTDGTNTVLLGGNNYLLNVSKDTTIALPAGIKLPANSLYINTNGNNVTVKLDANNWNEVIDLVDAEFTQSDVTIVLGGAKYELFGNEVCIYQDGAEKGAHHTYLKYNNPLYSFDLVLNADNTTNKVYNSSANLGYVALDKKDFTLSLNANSIVGVKQNSDSTDTTVVSTRDVEWSVHPDSEGVLKYENGKFTFTSGTVDTVKVVATATVDRNGYAPGVEGYDENNRASQTFEINVASISAGSVKVFDQVLASGSTTNITLVKTPDKDTYTIAKDGEFTYVNKNGVTLNEDITWTYEGTGVDGTFGTSTIKLTGKGAGVLTVKVGTYLTYKLNLTIEDTANFALQPKNMNNFTYLGNKNAVLLSDLFELKGTIPAGAQLVVFAGGSYAGDTYMTPNRTELQKTEDGVVGLSVDEPVRSLSITKAEDLANYAFNFTGTDASAIRIAVMHNGIRISEDIEVKIVDAFNIRDYSQIHTWSDATKVEGQWKDGTEKELSGKVNENEHTYTTSYTVTGKTIKVTVSWVYYTGYRTTGSIFNRKHFATPHTKTDTFTYTTEGIANADSSIVDNLVFVNNITMPANGYHNTHRNENGLVSGANHALIISGKTIYGNCFTFDITNGSIQNVNGIIVLNSANMQDLRVVGKVYPKIGVSGMDEYGTNAIHAQGTSTINNCYIANTRAPLATGYENATPHNVTVSNTVIYGGIYANIEHRGGTLNIGDNVITINQPHTSEANTTTATDKIAGLGITVWLEAPDGTKINGYEKLTQYNFIPSTYKGLPTVSISASGITASISTQNAFNTAFGDANVYKFGDDTKYINAGVVGQDVGKSNSDLVNTIAKVRLPYNDRTGLQASDNISYTSISVPVSVEGFNLSNAPVHLYTMKETDANKAVFAASANAECIYSPWEQSFTVETDTATTTTTCKAYGFNSEGKIVPTADYLAQLMTSTTTNK